MNKKFLNKNTIVFIVVLLAITLIVFVGNSYALFSKTEAAINHEQYTSGILNIVYSDDSSLTISPVPLTDAVGSSITPYTFTVTNNGNLDYKFNLKLLTDATYTQTHGCSTNQVPSSYIKVKINNGTPVLLSSLTNGTIMSDITLAAGASVTYNLRMWLDITTPNSVIGKHYHGKIVTEGEAIYIKPNAPMLADGMIPIKYDEANMKWVKADTSNTNNSWYDYNTRNWANAVMVSSGTRTTYMNAAVGTEVLESDILAYYVWIPRYKYQLFNVSSTSMSPIEIQIKFESGIQKTGIPSSTPVNGEWLTHPAFTFGTDELKGIWVGKFETTGDATTPTIKPNLTSLRNQNVSAQFTTSQKLGTSTYLTSAGVSQTDSHMLKNIEWGAVAYLSHSKYGKNSEIFINNSEGHYTGRSGGAVGGSTSYNTNGTYSYNGYTCIDASCTTGTINTTTKQSAYNASTTGNITGIYDMSGGSIEYVMGVMKDSAGTGLTYSSSGFTTETLPFNSKYADQYAYGTTYSDQTAYNRRILGDATGETRGWYGDIDFFVYSGDPWFDRGGNCYDGASAGAFYFSVSDGSAYSDVGVRVSLANVN